MQVLAKTYTSLSLTHSGYIAGSGNGIVTVADVAAACNIYLLNAASLAVERVQMSLDNGHYAFFNVDASKEYLVLARDYKREYEPFAWDYVKPADDLTIDKQQAMWASFLT